MTRMSLDERRRALVAAAIRVVSRDGVAAASTRAIAAEAGMPLASFHYAFESRDELLKVAVVEITEMEHREVDAELLKSFSESDFHNISSLEEMVRLSLEAYIDSIVAEPGREQALLELSLSSMRNPLLRHLPGEQYETYYQAIVATLSVWERRSGQALALPISELATILVVVLDGLTTNWLATRDTDTIKATLPSFAKFVSDLAWPERKRPALTGASPAASIAPSRTSTYS